MFSDIERFVAAVALPPAAHLSSRAPSGPVAGQGSVLGRLTWPVWPDVGALIGA